MNERPFEDEAERDPAIEATRPTAHEREVAEHEVGADPDRPAGGNDPRIEAGAHQDSEEDLAADRSGSSRTDGEQ